MKGKTLLSLAVVLSMLLAILPIMAVKAGPQTIVEVRFVENDLNSITKAPDQDVTVKIMIALADAAVIDFWDLEIHWDTTILTLKTNTTADVTESSFMNSQGGTVFAVQAPDTDAGILPDIGCGFLSGGPAMGSGELCRIKFHTKANQYGDGEADIFLPDLESYLLLGINLVPMDVVINGIVHVPPPVPTAPNAEFTPADAASFMKDDIVTLDGSASVDGIDTLPAPHSCAINEWKWEIDEGNDGSIESTIYGETQTYTASYEGIVGITLTVTAPDLSPPTHVDYVDHNSEEHVITVIYIVPSTGARIDVYTDRGGEEPIADIPGYPYDWSDAYGPQEQVCVYAKVTYNGEPVEYKPVAFEAIDPHGAGREFRVAFTNADGIATFCFRIPWEGSGAEDLFGLWTIIANVDVSEVTKTDFVKFWFGYKLEILALGVTPFNVWKPKAGGSYDHTLTIAVDITNICFSEQVALLTIVAHDECNVPIGLAYAYPLTVNPCGYAELPPGHVSHITGFTIDIPDWAYVGNGKIYANLFTDWLQYGGTPYCPEYTTAFPDFYINPTP